MTNETVKTYQNDSIQAQVILDRAAQVYRVRLSRLNNPDGLSWDRCFDEPVDAVVYARDLVDKGADYGESLISAEEKVEDFYNAQFKLNSQSN